MPIQESLDQLRHSYADIMDMLLSLPEEDKLEILRAYANALHIREGRTSRTQVEYLARIIRPASKLDSVIVNPAKRFFDSIQDSGTIIRGITSGCALYVQSHFDLGIYLPPYFNEVTTAMHDYLCQPETQLTLINQRGLLTLEGVLRTHAICLSSQSIITPVMYDIEQSDEMLLGADNQDTKFYPEDHDTIDDELTDNDIYRGRRRDQRYG
jgi:hypothetical protein